MKDERFDNILLKVNKEIKRQDEKWGRDRHQHPLEWLGIIGEEVGEVNKSVIDSHFSKEGCSVDNLNLNGYEEEMIQVIAVGLQALLDFEYQKRKKLCP